jgi:hypothetical protein
MTAPNPDKSAQVRMQLVETFAAGVAVGSGGVVSGGIEIGFGANGSQDLSAGGELIGRSEEFGVPKVGSFEGFRALGIGLVDCHLDAKFRHLPLDR